MLKKMHVFGSIILSFTALAADVTSERQQLEIEQLIRQAEEATHPDQLTHSGNENLQILYHLDTIPDLLKFSWYLVGHDEEKLTQMQQYLIKAHPDRSAEEFRLISLPQGAKALMIFFEMIKNKNLLGRVQRLRQEIDDETEQNFCQASHKLNPYVALLPYSTKDASDVGDGSVLIYEPALVQCKPVKFFKIQLFALAKKCPELRVSFKGSNRCIDFKGYQIWPVVGGVWTHFEEFLRDLKLYYSREYRALDEYDHNLFRMTTPGSTEAEKYYAVHRYVGDTPELLDIFKYSFSYIEAPLWQVSKLCAQQNATKDARSRYLKPNEPLNLVTIEKGLAHPAVLLLFTTISNDKDAQKLLAGIVFSKDIRDHLFAEAKRGGQAWHDWTNYPFTQEDMRVEGESKYNKSPLTSLLHSMNANYALLKDAMSEDLSIINQHFYKIWGSEITIDKHQQTKALEYSLAMALMAYSEPRLRNDLLKDEKLTKLLSMVPAEQQAFASRLVASMNTFHHDIVFIAQRHNKSLEQENLNRHAENVQIDAHNKHIDAECAAIAAKIDEAFADVIH